MCQKTLEQQRSLCAIRIMVKVIMSMILNWRGEKTASCPPRRCKLFCSTLSLLLIQESVPLSSHMKIFWSVLKVSLSPGEELTPKQNGNCKCCHLRPPTPPSRTVRRSALFIRCLKGVFPLRVLGKFLDLCVAISDVHEFKQNATKFECRWWNRHHCLRRTRMY